MPTYIVEIAKDGKISSVIPYHFDPVPNDPTKMWDGTLSKGVRIFAEDVEEAIQQARKFLDWDPSQLTMEEILEHIPGGMTKEAWDKHNS